jgi:hypothetical protein
MRGHVAIIPRGRAPKLGRTIADDLEDGQHRNGQDRARHAHIRNQNTSDNKSILPINLSNFAQRQRKIADRVIDRPPETGRASRAGN